jgi:ribonuclease HII
MAMTHKNSLSEAQILEVFHQTAIKDWPSIILELKQATLKKTLLKKIEQFEKRYHEYVRKLDHLKGLSAFDLSLVHSGMVIGVDEAGRGPLAGPVVAAACAIEFCPELIGLDDSKKISQKRRDELYDIIIKNARAYAVGIVSHEEIDAINILNATKKAMREAVIEVCEKAHIVGGIITDHVALTDLDYPVYPVVKGDQKSLAVAAASILAKVTRDRIMEAFDETYPGYGFVQHKGYGTKAHYDALDRSGPTPIHRITFL